MLGRTRRAVRSRLAATDLPVGIVDFIASVVRRTKLRRAEQLDVASELASHFAEGLARGKGAAELVRDYGEPVASARALRQSAISKRDAADRAFGMLCTWSLRGAIAAAAGYSLAATVLYFREPTISIDGNAVINSWVSQPGSEGAAIDLYVKALAGEGGGWEPLEGLSSRTPFPPEVAARIEYDEAAREWLRTWLAAHASEIEILREVRNRPALGMPLHERLISDERLAGFFRVGRSNTHDGSVLGTVLPHLAMLRRVSGWLEADAALAAHEGRTEDFVQDIEAILAAANHATEARFLVSALVSASIRDRAVWTTVSAIENHGARFSDDELARLDRAIRADRLDFARAIEGERLCMQDLIQRCYTDDGAGGGVALVRPLQELLEPMSSDAASGNMVSQEGPRSAAVDFAMAPYIAAKLPSRDEVSTRFKWVCDQLEAALREPAAEKSLALARDLDARIDELRSIDRFGSMMVKASQYISARWRREASVDSALAAIGIERFRRANARFPADLAELSKFVGRDLGASSDPRTRWNYALVEGLPVIFDAGLDGLDDRGRSPLVRVDDHRIANLSDDEQGGVDAADNQDSADEGSHVALKRFVWLHGACADGALHLGGPSGNSGGVTLRTSSAVDPALVPDPTQPIAALEPAAIETDGDFTRVLWNSRAAGTNRIVPARE
jgi:hypothetical protein